MSLITWVWLVGLVVLVGLVGIVGLVGLVDLVGNHDNQDNQDNQVMEVRLAHLWVDFRVISILPRVSQMIFVICIFSFLFS